MTKEELKPSEQSGEEVSMIDFRSIGFTSIAAEFPRDELAIVMFAAWNNVAKEKLSEPMLYFPNKWTRDAWTRVADAAIKHVTEQTNAKRSESDL